MLNLKQAAEMLFIHHETLREKAKAGLVPAHKFGRRWYFFQDELEKHIKSGKNQTVQNDTAMETLSCQNNLSKSNNAVKSGTTALPHQTANAYASLLGLVKNAKQ
ncbi:MAG: helix-turn-helix domain-containing protein [Conchiformibius sp.]|nr:helix-turn-helix domain-containing protein [Conchiformibius sp.]